MPGLPYNITSVFDKAGKTFYSSLFCTLVTAISSISKLSLSSSLSSFSDELAVTNVVAFTKDVWAPT